MKKAKPTAEQLNNEIQALHTQLAKANSDKEKLGKLLKERVDILKEDIQIANTHKFYEAEADLKNKLKQITECLTDCGITPTSNG